MVRDSHATCQLALAAAPINHCIIAVVTKCAKANVASSEAKRKAVLLSNRLPLYHNMCLLLKLHFVVLMLVKTCDVPVSLSKSFAMVHRVLLIAEYIRFEDRQAHYCQKRIVSNGDSKSTVTVATLKVCVLHR